MMMRGTWAENRYSHWLAPKKAKYSLIRYLALATPS